MNKRLVGWVLLCWLVGGLGCFLLRIEGVREFVRQQVGGGWEIVRRIADGKATHLFRPRIIDGDTIHYEGQRIRLKGIDAPERRQPYGTEATRALAKQLRRGKVTCRLEGKDKYNRHLGTCYVQGRNVNEWMVRNGYAWSYWTSQYRGQEELAQRQRKGVHRSRSALRPQQWRRKRGSANLENKEIRPRKEAA